MLGFAKLNPTYQNMGLSAVLSVSSFASQQFCQSAVLSVSQIPSFLKATLKS
jgi:hypothetical protein